MSKFKINVGRRDNVNPSSLIGFLNDQLNRRDVEIGKIEVLNTVSVFEIDAEYADALRAALRNADRGGREIVLEDAPDKDFSQKPSFGRRDEGSSGFKKPYAPNPRKDEGFAPRKTYGSREDRPRDEKPRGEGGYKPSFSRDRDDRPASASGTNRDKFAKRFGASPKPAAAAKPFSTKFKGKPKK